MHVKSKTLTKKRGRVALHLQSIGVGDDLCIILSGGDNPHIGAVALANTETVHSSALPPHKEEDLSRRIALKVTAAIGCNTAVVCGIHIDQITEIEIETVSELAIEMTEKLLEILQPEELNIGDEPLVEIFSDGACSGNPGPGGYGTILRYGSHVKEFSGFDPDTTNNRMEMLGAIVGLEQLKKPCKVRMTTDSQYLIKGMTEWIDGWIKKGWKNSQRKDVANRELWERLLELVKPHQVEWVWVKGHAGHDENERCDELARNAIELGY